MDKLDYINGNKFAKFAHYVISPPEGKLVTNEILSNDAIIFCTTDYLDYFFENIKYSTKNYILITHASDYTIDFNRFLKKPPCIIKWFAENGEYNHPDLISIPIGLENSESKDGAGIGASSKFFRWLSDNIEILKNDEKNINSVFTSFRVEYNFAHSVWVNPHRKDIIPTFKKNGLNYYQPLEKVDFKQHCERSSKYKFHASPQGNGIDCHRTWELLYMGCTPIVIKNKIYDDWNLPIIQINNWNELTNEFLKKYIMNTPSYNMDKSTMSYWKERITKEFKKL